MKIELKKDQYQKNRGGHTRLYDIKCENCATHICFYQKDGPGDIRRMYIDRIFTKLKLNPKKDLVCPNTKCSRTLGVPFVYWREDRPSFRLFQGAIVSKMVNSKKVNL